jgi:hypothetical protein
MNEELESAATVDDVDLSLVSLSPSEMPAAQAALSAWCERKQTALERELADLQEHHLIASGNGWKLHGLESAMNRAARRITYYGKVKGAVDAGYLIVPNFPVTVLAVRVRGVRPRRQVESEQEGAWVFNTKPQLLPAGEGHYVDDRMVTSDQSYQEPDAKGGSRRVDRYITEDFDEPDFPFTLMKPAVLAATERAMALHLFDTIGMVENRSGRDPIMVGQLLDPRGGDRRCTFFIAWWLNTRGL